MSEGAMTQSGGSERSGAAAGPTVSVIMPTYNQQEYIADAVSSLIGQTLKDWELLVVDDGSTDDTVRVLERFSDEPRVRVIRQPNRGQAIARNLALQDARGTYVAFLDSDNRWLPDKLRLQVEYLQTHPEVDVLYGGIRLIDGAGAALEVQDRYRPTGTIWRDLLVDNYVTFNTSILKRELLLAYGGQDPAVRYGPDFDLWLRMSVACRFEFLPEIVCEYRVEGHRVSDNVHGRMRSNEAAIARFLDANPGLLGRRERQAMWTAFYAKFSRAFTANRQHARALGLAVRALVLSPFSRRSWKGLAAAGWRSLSGR